ncbi:acetyl-CoA carboxylase carboxyl transferase subunit alpha [Helicobacter kayseriensis]|uniref:acetyl-CoA carboxylase carboxyl transferase subunit alpha n=1 Tax=Helicobacter kayseriensis TaxID=2905877 RepID=UPI001E43A1EF|nr:acetyl-CoA carboxylase carboxyl transferase subunit alpha [Helicobacter kayseriensis]MCE3046509.1 acetyl-CoA carboxylase carboxyl transferase subunit alpha [Helicobacter kayseriensis]MCE3048188.1 acetyl-CoA carboxylase carboxyl transferase subunit alpha [Helicobacter kayseriensis]
MAIYLDFEEKLKSIQDEIESAKIKGDFHAQEILEASLQKETQKVYSQMSEYQKMQLARHPDRPYAMDYINLILDQKCEIHGDRHFRDDKAIVCFLGYIDGQKALIIGEEKGRGTKNKLERNFGMPNPEGYRKALRAAKMAEKFNIPILMLVDTAGAYPGIGAEERGQSEAIAKNLQEFANLKVPTVSIIIGEGGSGGALAIAVADKLAMMSYSVFSVISPEGCSAILWNDPSKIESAMKAMKITAQDLKDYKLIDDIIEEPLSGAHRDKVTAAKSIKEYFLHSLETIKKEGDFLSKRYEKLMNYGDFKA